MELKITFGDYEKEILNRYAKEYNINTIGLIDAYQTAMESNFEQDIHDIALENEDALRKDYGEYEEADNE